MVGVGTSSSAATMPVTMKCGEDYGCVSSIVRFVVPMGTNVNRDGAALYEAVSVIFIVQVTIVGNSPVLLYCLFVC
jgi:Na+/H+-dicarboxylate symporter